MTERDRTLFAPGLSEVIDDALKLLLGDNVEAYFLELERHDRAVRTIGERVREQMQGKFQAILKGHTGEPEENGFGVAAETDVLRIRTHEAVRRALEAEHADHRRRVARLTRAKGKTTGEAGE